MLLASLINKLINLASAVCVEERKATLYTYKYSQGCTHLDMHIYSEIYPEHTHTDSSCPHSLLISFTLSRCVEVQMNTNQPFLVRQGLVDCSSVNNQEQCASKCKKRYHRTNRYGNEQLDSSLMTPLVISGKRMCWKSYFNYRDESVISGMMILIKHLWFALRALT